MPSKYITVHTETYTLEDILDMDIGPGTVRDYIREVAWARFSDIDRWPESEVVDVELFISKSAVDVNFVVASS